MGFDYQSLTSGQFQIPDGWKLTTIEKVAKVNEKALTPKNAPQHIQYIDIASVDKGELIDIKELSFKEAPSRARRVVRDKDSLISTVRPNLEHYMFVKKPDPNVIASTGYAVVSAKAVDPRFLYYYITTKPFTAYLTQIAESHTSAYPAFNPDVIEQAELLLPKDNEQRAIANILGSLDDKIELNRRMNQTLEAIASAIFKSWFIDFDPVHAKTIGRQTGLPSDIAALFPDKFEDSELGEIPKGWEKRTLESFAILKTQTIKPETQQEKSWWHFSIPAFDNGKQPILELGKNIKSGKYLVPNNSVLASKLNPQFPRVWLPDVQDTNSSICSTEFMPYVPVLDIWRPYLYEMLKSQPIQSEIINRVTGSTGSRQRVKPKEIAALPCLIPPKKLIDVFCSRIGPLHVNLLLNIRQSANLANLRDTLLPKLISGELRIPDAEKFIEEANL